jgi:nucleoside recognition membrane protein YjiH
MRETQRRRLHVVRFVFLSHISTNLVYRFLAGPPLLEGPKSLTVALYVITLALVMVPSLPNVIM